MAPDNLRHLTGDYYWNDDRVPNWVWAIALIVSIILAPLSPFIVGSLVVHGVEARPDIDGR